MRAAGLRPVQFWVPDTRLADFALELRKQCVALRDDGGEVAALHFAEEAAGYIEGWR